MSSDTIGGWHLSERLGEVPPGSQVVTWLFSGSATLSDASGAAVQVEPGVVTVTTRGGAPTVADGTSGVQLWCPGAEGAASQQFAPEPLHLGDHEVALLAGQWGWDDSPLALVRPLFAAEIRFGSDEPLSVDAEPGYQYALLVGSGEVDAAGTVVSPGNVHRLGFAGDTVTLRASHASAAHLAHVLVVGAPAS